MAAILKSVTASAGIVSLGTALPGVELCARKKEDSAWMFAMNHTNEEKTYSVDSSYSMIFGGEYGKLKPYEVHILKK